MDKQNTHTDTPVLEIFSSSGEVGALADVS